MKSVISVFVISIIHLISGLWLSSKSFSSVVSAVNAHRELTFSEQINDLVADFLFFPIVTIFVNSTYEGTSLFTKYIPFILNSAFWGILIVYGYKIIFHNKINYRGSHEKFS